jgi:GTP-binding protein HflX
VVDVSHPHHEEQILVVEETLRELGAGNTPSMLVFNKTDAYTHVEKGIDDLTPGTRENLSLDELKREWISKRREALFISALRKSNIDALKDQLYQKVKEIHIQRYPYNDLLY